MKKITKAAKIVLFVLLFLCLLFTGLMMFGGTIKGDPNETPVYTDAILKFAYGLIVLSIGTTLVFEVINILLHPVNASKSLIVLGVFAILFGISYAMADGTPLKILGYNGADNVPFMLKLTDMGLYAFYFLFGAAILAIVGAELSRFIK